MGKIEGIKALTPEIIEVVKRVESNTYSPSKQDIFFLTDKYNEVNTSHFKYSDVATCSDCRRHVFNFWKHIVNGQK